MRAPRISWVLNNEWQLSSAYLSRVTTMLISCFHWLGQDERNDLPISSSSSRYISIFDLRPWKILDDVRLLSSPCRSSYSLFFFSLSLSLFVTPSPRFRFWTFPYESFFVPLHAILASSSSDEDVAGCPPPKRARLNPSTTSSYPSSSSTSTFMHSSDHSQTTTADTTDSERLKHRSNSQSNGLVTSSKNGHEKSCSSTQTTSTAAAVNNGNSHSTRLFTHSQREILRLVGQHLQSVGLK